MSSGISIVIFSTFSPSFGSKSIFVKAEQEKAEGGRSSRLVYTPRADTDYGSVTCRASNRLGSGAPCVYIILPSGLARQSSAVCSVNTVTHHSFRVK